MLLDILGGILLIVGSLFVGLMLYLALFVGFIYGGMRMLAWMFRKLPQVDFNKPNQDNAENKQGLCSLTKEALDCYIKRCQEESKKL